MTLYGLLMLLWRDESVSEMKRLSVYLPDPVYQQLEEWANEEKRSLSNLAGFLLEASVRDRQREQVEPEQPKKKE